MNNMLLCNYLVGLVGAIIGAMIMQASAAFPMAFTENGPGPGFWPFSLGTALLATAVFLLVYSFLHRSQLHEEKVRLNTGGNKRVYMMMGLVVVFTGLIDILGFYLSAMLMIPAVMKLMDYHNYKYIALTTVCTVVFIYVVFGMVLRTPMPEGILF